MKSTLFSMMMRSVGSLLLFVSFKVWSMFFFSWVDYFIDLFSIKENINAIMLIIGIVIHTKVNA